MPYKRKNKKGKGLEKEFNNAFRRTFCGSKSRPLEDG